MRKVKPSAMRSLRRLPVSVPLGSVGVGVAIDAHLVAELAAEHLVDRDAIGLAGEVPERDLDRRDAAALPAVAAELLDAAEQPVDVARVLAEQPALQHQRVGGAGAVAHLAKPDDALVGVDLEQRRGERRADDFGDPHVGDAKLGRLRVRVHPIERLVGPTRLWHDLSSFWSAGLVARTLGRHRALLAQLDLVGLQVVAVHLDAETRLRRQLEAAVRIVERRVDEVIVFAEVPLRRFELVEIGNGHHHLRAGDHVDRPAASCGETGM